MKVPFYDKRHHIGKVLLAYSGASWVIIQVINLIVSQYNWSIAFLDVSILIFLLGLPSVFIFAVYGNSLAKKLRLLYGINLFLLIGIITYYFVQPDSLKPNEIKFLKFQTSKQKIIDNINSIVVLPFTNVAGDSESDYIATATHTAIISELKALNSLRVISETSSRAVSADTLTLRQIADELNVNAVVEGSIMVVDNQIKILVSLMSPIPEETQLWSNEYNLPFNALLTVFPQIARNLIEEMHLELSVRENNLLNKEKNVNARAHEYYMRGIHSLSFLDFKNIQLAEKYFQKAVSIDPEYADAYGGLAGVWVAYKQMLFKPADSTDHKIDEYIHRSFKLDSLNAEVWRWHAASLSYKYRWNECLEAIKKCIDLNPNFAEAYAFYAHFAMMNNEWQTAWSQMDKAIELDPLNPLINRIFIDALLMFNGNYDELLTKYNGPLQNQYPQLFFPIYANLKNHDLAINSLKFWINKFYPEDMSKLIDDWYLENDFSTTLNLTAEYLKNKSDTVFIPPTVFVMLYYMADNKEDFLYWLERMYFRKDPNLPYWAILGPYSKSWLFEEPRYKDLMRQINLWSGIEKSLD